MDLRHFPFWVRWTDDTRANLASPDRLSPDDRGPWGESYRSWETPVAHARRASAASGESLRAGVPRGPLISSRGSWIGRVAWPAMGNFAPPGGSSDEHSDQARCRSLSGGGRGDDLRRRGRTTARGPEPGFAVPAGARLAAAGRRPEGRDPGAVHAAHARSIRARSTPTGCTSRRSTTRRSRPP